MTCVGRRLCTVLHDLHISNFRFYLSMRMRCFRVRRLKRVSGRYVGQQIFIVVQGGVIGDDVGRQETKEDHIDSNVDQMKPKTVRTPGKYGSNDIEIGNVTGFILSPILSPIFTPTSNALPVLMPYHL